MAVASEANLRAAQSTLAALLTMYKSDAGKLIGLRDDRLVLRKTNFELKIRRAVEGADVTLSGTVHNWAERDLATRSAWGTAGVRNVVDKLNLVY